MERSPPVKPRRRDSAGCFRAGRITLRLERLQSTCQRGLLFGGQLGECQTAMVLRLAISFSRFPIPLEHAPDDPRGQV